jgi:hypothetical protein
MTPDELRELGRDKTWNPDWRQIRAAADAWEQDRRRLDDAHFMIGEISKKLRDEMWMNEVDSP